MELEDYVNARKAFTQSYETYVSISLEDENNLESKSDEAIALQKLGALAEAQGKNDLAKTWYRKSIQVRNEMGVTSSSTSKWKLDLAETYYQLGSLESARERRSTFELARAILSELKKLDAIGEKQGVWLKKIEESLEQLGTTNKVEVP